MQYKRVVLALGVAMGLSMAGAQADVLLAARLSDFGYSLTDLRPDDGMAPGLSIDGALYELRVDVLEGPYTLRGGNFARSNYVQRLDVFQDGDSVFRSVAGPRNTASFGISGSLAGRDVDIFMEGAARNTWADPLYYSRVLLYNPRALKLGMTLAPHTRMVWTGSLEVEAEHTMGRRGKRVEKSEISGHVTLYGENGEHFGADGISILLPEGGRERREDQRDINLSFSNLSDSPRLVFMDVIMAGDGFSFHPVPEPGSVGLMVCGMGVLAGVVRRRRRVAQ